MLTIDDETLMAYVDGELEALHEARVRDRLRGDPELRRRARIFEDSARALREAFRSELDRPVSENVLELLRHSSESTAARQRSPAAARWSFRSGGRPVVLALAASLLLAVGVTVGSLVTTIMDSGRTSRR